MIFAAKKARLYNRAVHGLNEENFFDFASELRLGEDV